VDSVGAGTMRDFKDQVTAKIGVERGRGAEAVGFIRFQNVGRGAVGVGEDGHGEEIELAACADEAKGDFAAIGNEDFAQHRRQGIGRQSLKYSRNAKGPRGCEGLWKAYEARCGYCMTTPVTFWLAFSSLALRVPIAFSRQASA